jgi:hypothetical protein
MIVTSPWRLLPPDTLKANQLPPRRTRVEGTSGPKDSSNLSTRHPTGQLGRARATEAR